ncbi:unnamed protein product [Timema podura]|uniref:glutaminase n=1 Tax=Timema podura TaxID=61482 RepID=A0ABN7NPP9_TIMPD|nr:unnamed protein product [Timema podura]
MKVLIGPVFDVTIPQALEDSGLRKTDPRLEQVMKLLDDFSRAPQRENGGATSQLSVRLNPEVFKEIISPNVRLISQAFTNQLIVPDFTEFCDQINMFYDKCKTNQDGKVASYIPQLAKMTPSYWGVSVCTIDGQRCSFGDTNIPFTLQSCSKPLTYAIALEELGNEKVHAYVGQEPSGRMFNELVLDSQILSCVMPFIFRNHACPKWNLHPRISQVGNILRVAL